MDILTQVDARIAVAAFSLAWFLAGLLAGWRLSDSRSGEERGRRRGKGAPVEIYVGNLSYKTTERDLRRLFGEYGRVLSVRVIKDRSNNRSKGYGFVLMAEAGAATAAIQALNGQEFGGRHIVTNEAKSQPREE